MMLCLAMVKSMLLRVRMNFNDDIPDYGELFGDPEDDDPGDGPSAGHPSRNDGDGFDDDPQDDVPDIAGSGSGRVTSYEKRGKFLPPANQGSSWGIIMKWPPSGMVIIWSLILKILSRMQSDLVFTR